MGHFRELFDGAAMTIGKEGPSQVTISWTTAIALFPIMLGLITLISWALTNSIQANNTSVKVVELRGEMADGFRALRDQVAGLPMQAATLKQVDERGRELIVSLNSVAQNLVATDRTAYEAAAATKRLEQQFDQRIGRVEQRLDRVEQQVNHAVPLRETR